MLNESSTESRTNFQSWSTLLLALTLVAFCAESSPTSASTVVTFGGDSQHTARYQPAAQNLNAIRWQSIIDQSPSGALAHYGAPLITAANTVLVPVKISGDGFEV